MPQKVKQRLMACQIEARSTSWNDSFSPPSSRSAGLRRGSLRPTQLSPRNLAGLPSRSLERTWLLSVDRPAYALRASARQPSLDAALQAKAGASDWNRTSDLGLMSPTL